MRLTMDISCDKMSMSRIQIGSGVGQLEFVFFPNHKSAIPSLFSFYGTTTTTMFYRWQQWVVYKETSQCSIFNGRGH
jgi:hypothetical protein